MRAISFQGGEKRRDKGKSTSLENRQIKKARGGEMDNNKIDKFTFYELYADILQGLDDTSELYLRV